MNSFKIKTKKMNHKIDTYQFSKTEIYLYCHYYQIIITLESLVNDAYLVRAIQGSHVILLGS